LEVRNNLAERQVSVRPILRTAGGAVIELGPLSVASEEVVSINLREAIAKLSNPHTNRDLYGSVELRFQGLDAANVFASTVVRMDGQPIDFHFDGSNSEPNWASAGIEGIWWVPAISSSAYLLLTNPFSKPVQGSLEFATIEGQNHRSDFIIPPGRTSRINLKETLGLTAVGQMGGLTLRLPNKELILANEIVFDDTTGLSAIMKLFDRDAQEQVADHVLRAPMMALSRPDPSLAFPSGTTLVPRVFLWNASQTAMPVSVSLDWSGGTDSGTYHLPVNLAPGQVHTLDLGQFQRNGGIPQEASWSTVKIAYSGRSADLVAVALSYDETYRYGLQTPFSEGTNRVLKGSMWHADGIHNTLITTGNGGTESTTAQLTLFYNEGKNKYTIEKTLSPDQRLWVDVGQLIRNQNPDSNGHVIPPETTAGSYEIRDLDHATVGLLYEGKLVIDKTYGHASYGCASCCGYKNPSLLPNPFAGPTGIDNLDVIQAEEQCGGYIDDVTGGGYSWSSSNTLVATLPTRTLHTVAIGSATGSAHISLQALGPAPRCPMQVHIPSQPVQVGKRVDLAGTNCTTSGGVTFSGNWGDLNNLASCGLSDPILVPSGGSCIQEGTTKAGTPKYCYQTVHNNCVTTYCPVSVRTVDSPCTKFIDSSADTVTTSPAGCS
jgi:hypothetical protein